MFNYKMCRSCPFYICNLMTENLNLNLSVVVPSEGSMPRVTSLPTHSPTRLREALKGNNHRLSLSLYISRI